MLSGSLSVAFFVHIHDVIVFNVQLRNKYDDDDDFNNLLSPVGNDHLTKLPPHSTALPHYLANKQRTKRCHLLTGSPAVYVFLQASIRRII